jgi:hypothetical protein
VRFSQNIPKNTKISK